MSRLLRFNFSCLLFDGYLTVYTYINLFIYGQANLGGRIVGRLEKFLTTINSISRQCRRNHKRTAAHVNIKVDQCS
ncbi:hypothetical protein ACHWQZ_G005075 [Mnemiopsis leidyi]